MHTNIVVHAHIFIGVYIYVYICMKARPPMGPLGKPRLKILTGRAWRAARARACPAARPLRACALYLPRYGISSRLERTHPGRAVP